MSLLLLYNTQRTVRSGSMGGGATRYPNQKYIDEVWRAYHAEKAAAQKLKKKKKKVLAALEDAAEAIAAVEAAPGLLSLLAPVQELKAAIELPAVDVTAKIAAIKEATELLVRMLDEEDEEILLIWVLS